VTVAKTAEKNRDPDFDSFEDVTDKIFSNLRHKIPRWGTIHSLETQSGHPIGISVPEGRFSGRALGRTENHPTQGLTTASS